MQRHLVLFYINLFCSRTARLVLYLGYTSSWRYSPTARAAVGARSWSGHFATDTCDQGGRWAMHDSLPIGTLAVDVVWRNLEDLCFASARIW